MQRYKLRLESSQPTLVKHLGARAIGAALLATVPACSDALEDLKEIGSDIQRVAGGSDAGPAQGTPSRVTPEAGAPASGEASSVDDAPASDDASPSPASSAPASDDTSSSADDTRDGDGEVCVDACEFSFDGECDDGRPGSVTDLCPPNTDCGDCGSRRASDLPGGEGNTRTAFDDLALSWEHETFASGFQLQVSSTLVLCSSGLVLLFEDELSFDGSEQSFFSLGFEWSVDAGSREPALDARFVLSDRDEPVAPFTRRLSVEVDSDGAPARLDGAALVDIDSVGAECLGEAALLREECQSGELDAAGQAACDAGRAAGVL